MSFGFPWSGPRLVAGEGADPQNLSKDVSAILGAQFALGTACSIIFVLWTLKTTEPLQLRLAQWSILASAIFTTIVPAWLFQGLERMRELVIPQLVLRTASTIAIIILIRSRGDLLLYVGINATSALFGAIAFSVLLRRCDMALGLPTLGRMKLRLRESSSVFVSNAAISFYTTANVLIVSYVLGTEAAGIFGLADRIRGAAMGLLVPMTQAIYPFVCRTIQSDTDEERKARRRMFQIMIWTSVAMGVALFVSAPWAVSILGGVHFEAATPVVRIFALIPLLVTITNILGVQIMLPRKMDRSVAAVVIACGALGVALQLVLTRSFGVEGSAWAYVMVELAVCCGFGAALTIGHERAVT